mgnify:CR=1 FL=1
MARDVQSLTISDLSQFAKQLRADLLARDQIPSHASMLSAIAKAAGYDNHQHLKAAQPAPVDPQLKKAQRVFDTAGIMTRWPKQTTTQALCMWAFWTRLPADTDMTEKQVNAVLIAGHRFGDHALLRRSLIDHRLVTRTNDGATYRRIERAPPDLAAALIAGLTRPEKSLAVSPKTP